jgi:E3 ubiquitin-protein ligase HUWE1
VTNGAQVSAVKSKGVPPPASVTTTTTSATAASAQLSEIADADIELTVDSSPLARLMLMLDSPVLRHNPPLMDKMLTCLAYASAGIPQLDTSTVNSNSAAAIIRSTNRAIAAAAANPAVVDQNGSEPQQTTAITPAMDTTTEPAEPPLDEPVLSAQIELVVSVLKNKLCTQDGLQQAYTLLNNLSKINAPTRTMIIQHLLKGTKELGMAVCNEIERLLDEAVKYNHHNPAVSQQRAASVAAAPDQDTMMDVAASSSTSPLNNNNAGGGSNRMFSTQQQTLIDSYSNLVISSPKQKTARGELQLPSMSILVEKNANQKFFVRLIRLIINLREAIEKEHKKRKSVQSAIAAAAAAATTTAAAAAATAATPAANGSAATAPADQVQSLTFLVLTLDLNFFL